MPRISIGLICVLLLFVLLPVHASVPATGWEARLGAPGVDGAGWVTDPLTNPPTFKDTTAVSALAIQGDSWYIGGNFRSAGGIAARNIARWDRQTGQWSALGSGVNGRVQAIVLSATDVYVAGSFTEAGGQAALRVARWHIQSQTWFPLGAGLGDARFADNQVRALALWNGVVYAAGFFEVSGSTTIKHIARWTGSTWEPLGVGVDGQVNALAVFQNQLIAGGHFSNAGASPAARIAGWNGTSWSALGSGISDESGVVFSFASDQGALYVAGLFNAAGGQAMGNLARWNGTQWSSLGAGLTSTQGVAALALWNGQVAAGGDLASGIQLWNGSSWVVPAAGVDGTVETLASAGDQLVVGGVFRQAGSRAANHVARWNTTTWLGLGAGSTQSGVRNQVQALAGDSDQLYVGGIFEQVDRLSLGGIAAWDRATGEWQRLGGYGVLSLPADVRALAVTPTDVYVGGVFRKVGGTGSEVDARSVARWDRAQQQWFALGTGLGTNDLPAEVQALLVDAGQVYAAGSFATAGATPVNQIARWDGTTWQPLGSGLAGGTVYALARFQGVLYAGGSFTTAGGVPAQGLARWDGKQWTAVDSAFQGVVYALTVANQRLWVGGDFRQQQAASIAAWDGQRWLEVGSAQGSDPVVYALTPFQGGVLAAGRFQGIGAFESPALVWWNGVTWMPLAAQLAGGGPDGPVVRALAAPSDQIFIGGLFTAAGGQPSAYVAAYTPPPMPIQYLAVTLR